VPAEVRGSGKARLAVLCGGVAIVLCHAANIPLGELATVHAEFDEAGSRSACVASARRQNREPRS
jgi:hypothetical protein